MRVWYVLFAESPGFSPSREFSCFLPSPFVQLFCAQSGDPGGASASGQFSSDQEASKALGHTFLSFLLHTLRWPFLLFLLTYGGYGEKPFSSPSVCQIASRGELEMKKILVCDPSLRFSLCLSETFVHCVKAGLFPDLICRNARGFWGAELVGLPHRLPYLKLVTSAEAFSQVVYSWGKYWPWLSPRSCLVSACVSSCEPCPDPWETPTRRTGWFLLWEL